MLFFFQTTISNYLFMVGIETLHEGCKRIKMICWCTFEIRIWLMIQNGVNFWLLLSNFLLDHIKFAIRLKSVLQK